MSKIAAALKVVQSLQDGKQALDGYQEGDIVELFEILSEHNKLTEFQFLATYVWQLNQEILAYMNDQICRLDPDYMPPYAKKPYRYILWSVGLNANRNR